MKTMTRASFKEEKVLLLVIWYIIDRIRSSVIHDPSIIKDAIDNSFLLQVKNGSDLNVT